MQCNCAQETEILAIYDVLYRILSAYYSFFHYCSDDEFGLFSSRPNAEIAEQLIRDGYDLDLAPDDEDLDLIPPRPLSERCGCCTSAHLTTCVLQ